MSLTIRERRNRLLVTTGLLLVVSSLLSLCVKRFNEYRSTEAIRAVEESNEQGVLIVKAGSIVRLAAGRMYEFKSILIHEGGTLEFYGNEAEWTVLKTSGHLWLYGTIRSRGFKAVEEKNHIKEFKIAISEQQKPEEKNMAVEKLHQQIQPWKYWKHVEDDRKSIWFTTVKQDIWLHHEYGSINKGGTGGAGGRPAECARFSCYQLVCQVGDMPSSSQGGKGGTGISEENLNLCESNSGGEGCSECYLLRERKDKGKPDKIANCHKCEENSAKGRLSPGTGGEGGGAGTFGGLIYMSVGGNLYGQGIIDVSGGKGGKGDAGESNKFSGGGGGGGGAGGNGGAVIFNIKGDPGLPTLLIDGGLGGDGGPGGVPHKKDGYAELKGEDGKKGEAGTRGISDFYVNRSLLSSFKD